jgi:hypothetical protein
MREHAEVSLETLVGAQESATLAEVVQIIEGGGGPLTHKTVVDAAAAR